jgi:hypothetical protein
MAETPFAQVGLLAVAVNWTGDTTVALLSGLDTVTPAAGGVPLEVKVAAIEVAPLTVTVQVAAVPQLPPVQPVNVYPLPAVAVSRTSVPEEKLAEQVEGQLIPAGLLATVPVPVMATAKGYDEVEDTTVILMAVFAEEPQLSHSCTSVL